MGFEAYFEEVWVYLRTEGSRKRVRKGGCAGQRFFYNKFLFCMGALVRDAVKRICGTLQVRVLSDLHLEKYINRVKKNILTEERNLKSEVQTAPSETEHIIVSRQNGVSSQI